LSFTCFKMWQRNVNCHGVATWLRGRPLNCTVLLGSVLRLRER
jgi:hypothetical protein